MPRITLSFLDPNGRKAELIFGALAPALLDQLKMQELACEGDIVQHQRCVDEIGHLYYKSILTKEEVERARRRLIKPMKLRRVDDAT